MTKQTFVFLSPRARPLLLLTAAALTLAGCEKLGIGGKDDSKPTGPVVAKLDGEEITALEVNAELQGTPIPPTMTRRDAERVALNNIITRRMLAKSAQERTLDKKPEFFLQQRRMEEQLKVQALARDIASKVVTPTRDEADKFMNENPYLFAERKFFILDQIQFLRPDNIATLGFEAAKTMPEVEAILNANKIPFRRQPASLDSLGANPSFVKEVTKVLQTNPNELFMFASRPQGAPAPVVLVNQVKESRVQPFTGDKAREFATNYLRNERIQNALKAEVEKQQKSQKERVVFQPGWETKPEAKPVDPKALGGKVPIGPAAPTPLELPGGAEDMQAGHNAPAAPAESPAG
jgi:EpsD family peptidyl-prolyl cis-trans isomerase